MANIAIYTESSNDDKTIACLANKLAEFKQVRPIVIHKIHKGSYLNRKFHEVIRNWLKKVDCIIFLTDRDGPIANHQRRQNQNSLINRIESIVDNNKVFLVEVVHELEAWLLVDCIGIFCYYATTKNARNYKDNCRNKVSADRALNGWVNRYQKGDTEKIVEAVPGARNAKEHLANFSEDILRKLNPNIPEKNVRREKYSPTISHKIAAFICINIETLDRNKSFKHFG